MIFIQKAKSLNGKTKIQGYSDITFILNHITGTLRSNIDVLFVNMSPIQMTFQQNGIGKFNATDTTFFCFKTLTMFVLEM
jgi:hypothetical protein